MSLLLRFLRSNIERDVQKNKKAKLMMCCTKALTSRMTTKTHESVRRQYARYIQQGGDGDAVLSDRAEGLGYDKEFLESCGFHTDAAMALESLFVASCGSGCPLRFPGSPRAGETVIDLGCGAGHDAIIASRIVGSNGQVIGVDITPEMIEAAEKNTSNAYMTKEEEGATCCSPGNIKFLRAAFDDIEELERVLLDAESGADVVISNGVFNLCDDKNTAFATAFWLLKPGGRLLFSDLCRVAVAVVDQPTTNPSGVCVLSCSIGDGWSN
jgi:arsenite methyltransferase